MRWFFHSVAPNKPLFLKSLWRNHVWFSRNVFHWLCIALPANSRTIQQHVVTEQPCLSSQHPPPAYSLTCTWISGLYMTRGSSSPLKEDTHCNRSQTQLAFAPSLLTAGSPSSCQSQTQNVRPKSIRSPPDVFVLLACHWLPAAGGSIKLNLPPPPSPDRGAIGIPGQPLRWRSMRV